MALMIYNSLTRKKEVFESLEPGKVKMYVCGPTVYDFVHVGNFRGPVFFNVVRNWLEKSGYQVDFVLNYTDVDDKIINRALKDGVSTQEVTEKYIAEFKYDYDRLRLRPHTHNPRVTEYMQPIVELIKRLVDNDKAYVVEGEVLFSIDSYPDYGKLSKKNLEELQVGTRIEPNKKKRNPLDFTLWKPAKPGEPSWESPWGLGRPGWHIECSAMAMKLLGETIDIHGGGSDLIFPHHENEIAQSEGACHKPYVRYWMHNNMINLGDQKMSKSLGNILTGRAFLDQYNAEIYKYMILSAHYRSQIDFSEVQVHQAIAGLARIYAALDKAKKIMLDPLSAAKLDPDFQSQIELAQKGVKEAFDDDFNTSEVVARVFEMVRSFNASYKLGQKVTPQIKARAEAFVSFVNDVGEVLAMFHETPHTFLQSLDDLLLQRKNLKRETIDALVKERIEARANKDFKKSDEVRDHLLNLGILILDTPQGTFWEVDKS